MPPEPGHSPSCHMRGPATTIIGIASASAKAAVAAKCLILLRAIARIASISKKIFNQLNTPQGAG